MLDCGQISRLRGCDVWEVSVCVSVCVCVCPCMHACMRVWWSCLSVLARGWLCHAASGHTEKNCVSPVTGHPLTCACSVNDSHSLH